MLKFKNECAGFMIQNSTKVCTITLNDLSINPPPSPPPPPPSNGNVDAKFPSEIKKANHNEMVVLDGSSSIGSITNWTIGTNRWPTHSFFGKCSYKTVLKAIHYAKHK